MQRARHLLDACSAHAHRQHVALARCQRAGAFAQRGVRQLRVDDLLASCRAADRRGELVGRGVLEQEAADAGVDGAAQVAGTSEDREDEHAAGGKLRAKFGRRRDPILAGHLDVEESDVWFGAPGLVEDAVAAFDLGDDLDVVYSRKQRGEGAADHRLVLGDQDRDQATGISLGVAMPAGRMTRRRTPASGSVPTSNLPPASSTRSRRPISPTPPPSSEAAPRPSSTSSSAAPPSARVRRSTALFAPLCLRTLVTPSRRHQASTESCSAATRPKVSSTRHPMPAACSALRALPTSMARLGLRGPAPASRTSLGYFRATRSLTPTSPPPAPSPPPRPRP